MSTETKIKTAAARIDATKVDADHHVYYADEVSDWILTTGDALCGLADLLEHDDEDIRRDAYSHWCSGDTDAVYLGIGHEADCDDAIEAARRVLGESEQETSTKTQRITIETTEANGNRLDAGTYWIEMPAGYDVDAITGEDVLLDDALRIMPELGEMVCGGEPGTDDYDEGEVVDYAGADALVAWDSGVRTWTPTSPLTAL
jgi:hypothetical protein